MRSSSHWGLLLAPTGKQASLARIRQSRGFVFEYPAVETGTASDYWFARVERATSS